MSTLSDPKQRAYLTMEYQPVSLRRSTFVACAVLALLTVQACGVLRGDESAVRTAADVVEQFKAAGLPISKSIVFTEATDPNDQMGTAGSYTSKASWWDDRIDQTALAVDPEIAEMLPESNSEWDLEHGGTVEVFANDGDAERRAEYVKALGNLAPEHHVLGGNVLVRLSPHLSLEQAAGYEAALEGEEVAATTASPPAVHVPETQPPATDPPAMPTYGDAVRDGKFEFVVVGPPEQVTQVGEEPFVDTALGGYVIFTVRVTNIGNEAEFMDESGQELIDSEGRKYSSTMVSAYSDVYFTELNPGNSLETKVVFDVPEGITPVNLVLHDSPFSAGVDVAVPLP